MRAVRRALPWLVLLALGCAEPQRWQVREQPTTAEAGLLLQRVDPQALRREYASTEVPRVPVRERLRPCCAFGMDLGTRLGRVPVPAYSIGNIRGRDEVGPHTYDSGVLHVRQSVQQKPLLSIFSALVCSAVCESWVTD